MIPDKKVYKTQHNIWYSGLIYNCFVQLSDITPIILQINFNRILVITVNKLNYICNRMVLF